VNFEDDLLTLNHRHVYALCDEITARGLKFNWSIFSRVDTVSPELLGRIREAGCTWMLYGVESGNQHILNTIKKRITLDKIRDAVRMAREAGIDVLASFIIGLPGETRETLKETVEFALSLDTSWGLNVLSPFPGSEVREKAAEYGIEILSSNWLDYDANTAVTRTKEAGPQEIAEVLHRYNEELEGFLEALEKEGALDPAKASQLRVRSPLAQTLLQGDIIEGLGVVEISDDPLEGLIAKLKETVPYTHEQISENIRSWTDQGLLTYDLDGRHVTWRWS
jgi:radical SAM superfamily enzyme YgiQ (UPF0313 family)